MDKPKSAREAAEKWLRDNDWDYQKYGDRRGDRSAYDTLMNYEISGVLEEAFVAGYARAVQDVLEDIGELKGEALRGFGNGADLVEFLERRLGERSGG